MKILYPLCALAVVIGSIFISQTASATGPSAAHPSPNDANPALAERCAALATVTLDGTSIRKAEYVPAGKAMIPNTQWSPQPGKLVSRPDLPAFCRINVTMKPETGSAIGVEVWLPTKWNGRFLGTGNGGGAGALVLDAPMQQNLKRGFAVANTDLGTAPDIMTTMGQPMRWRDFGYRANHEMVRAARAFVKAFYGRLPNYSYFSGCSTGGQQALVNAERYPADYQGILVQAPVPDRTHIHMSFIWSWNALVTTPNSKLSQATLNYVHSEIIKACGVKDGGAPSDDFLTDPRRCNFEPANLQRCKSGKTGDCVSDAQVIALKKLYSGAVNPRTGERIFAPLAIGSEAMAEVGPLAQEADNWPPQQFYPFYWTFGRDNFQPSRFDFDKDVDRVDAELAGMLNANTVDLSTFRQAGGKILWYHGLQDPGVSFEGSIDYYERLVEANDGNLSAVQNFVRLFLIPGMDHCSGGPGAWNIGQDVMPGAEQDPQRDALIALVDWVEHGRAPNQLLATKYLSDDTSKPILARRPICMYPALPTYVGGDASKPSSFRCEIRPRGSKYPVARRYLN